MTKWGFEVTEVVFAFLCVPCENPCVPCGKKINTKFTREKHKGHNDSVFIFGQFFFSHEYTNTQKGVLPFATKKFSLHFFVSLVKTLVPLVVKK